MADTAFTVKVDNRTFVLDRITLGDWRMFKTEFGLGVGDITSTYEIDGKPVEILNLDNPNVLVALMVAALIHERPTEPTSDLIAEVEALTIDGLEFPDAESASGESEGNKEDPTEGGDDDSEATASRSKGGNSAKPRKKPGRQS